MMIVFPLSLLHKQQLQKASSSKMSWTVEGKHWKIYFEVLSCTEASIKDPCTIEYFEQVQKQYVSYMPSLTDYKLNIGTRSLQKDSGAKGNAIKGLEG